MYFCVINFEFFHPLIYFWDGYSRLITPEDFKNYLLHLFLYFLMLRTSFQRQDVQPGGTLSRLIWSVIVGLNESFLGLDSTDFNFNVPKVETLKYIPKSIEYLDLPIFQSTATWESTHINNRLLANFTNPARVDQDVAKLVTFLLFNFMVY